MAYEYDDGTFPATREGGLAKVVLPYIGHGEEQLKSYMAASAVCRLGLWVGQERFAFERDRR